MFEVAILVIITIVISVNIVGIIKISLSNYTRSIFRLAYN